MATITKFDKANLGTLRKEIEKALSVLEKYGLTGSIGKITFGDTSFTAKLEVTTGNDGEAQFKKYASMYNLKPEWFGETFESKGETYTVIGLDTNRPKFPVVVRTSDGKTANFRSEGLRIHLGDHDEVRKELNEKFRSNFIMESFGGKLNRAWLGQQFIEGDRKYTIIGLSDGRLNRKVISESEGTNYAVPMDAFLAAIGNKQNKHLADMPKT